MPQRRADQREKRCGTISSVRASLEQPMAFAWSNLLAVRSHAQREWRFTNHRRAVILFLIVLVLSETVLVLEIES